MFLPPWLTWSASTARGRTRDRSFSGRHRVAENTSRATGRRLALWSFAAGAATQTSASRAGSRTRH